MIEKKPIQTQKTNYKSHKWEQKINFNFAKENKSISIVSGG